MNTLPTGKRNVGRPPKNGDTNTHEDRTRQKLASLYPVAADDG